jgi:hypothetical protein
MISPLRHDILRLLECVSALAPDVRFGQLVANLAFLAAGPWDQTLWDLEDEQLLTALQQHAEDLARRQEGALRRSWQGATALGIGGT